MSSEEERKKQQEKNIPIKEEKRSEISRWGPEDYLSEMDRRFDELARRLETINPFQGFWPRLRWPEVAVGRAYSDLIDAGSEYRVVAEVPGIPKDKLDITVTDKQIRIEGEAMTSTKDEKEGYVRRERSYSRISRVLNFPEAVNSEKAEAKLENGILEVKVPKKVPTRAGQHKVIVK